MAGRSTLRGRSALLRLSVLIAVVAGVLAAVGPASALATEAPIAAWSFDEGHGEVAHDVYGSHDGTLEHSPSDSPPEWSNGRFGDALRFQGQGYQCVNVPQSPDLELQGSFTIETWVKPEGTGVEEPLIFKEAAPGHEAYLGYMLYLGLESNGKVGGYVEEPGYEKTEVTSEKLPVGRWTHLALAFDAAEHKLRLYVDGEFVDSVDAEGPQPTEGPLKFGCSEIYGQDFEGRLDEVRIYDRALSAEEVGHDMTTALQTPAPSQAPVASYSFDEEASPGKDLSGGGRDATLEGATWTPHGRYGGAVELDGEDSLSIPAVPGLHVEEEFTVEAWVRPEGNTDKYSPLISKETEGTEEEPWFLYEGSWVANQPYGGLEGETPGETDSHAGEPIPQDRWTHLAFTFDGSKTRLYVDGELLDEDAGAEPVISEGKIELGADQSGHHFKGRIDEVRIYNRALDTAEVAADMGAPLQTPRSGPVAAWAFDEGTGTTAVDTTGDGHTATIEGATWTRGRYGNGLDTDTEGACATVGDVEGLQMDEEFTFETWLRSEAGTGEANPFLTMEDTEPPTGHEPFSWVLLAGGEEVPKAWIRNGEELGFKGIYGTVPLPKDAWAHVALTDDGATLRLYVNGELVRTAAAPEMTAASGPLEIGCGGGYHFEGRIDETRIYHRALGAGEVAADMETPIQTPKREPVAEYSFDEEGESYEDASGDGHTATGEGVTWTSHGRYGGAVELDGKQGCLTIAASEELQFSEEFSLEAWVRPEGSEEEAHPVISQDDLTSPGEEEPFAYELLAGENEKPKAWVRKPGSGFEGVYGEEPLPERTWSHLALVDDGAHIRLYVDGRLVDEEISPPLAISKEGLKIGCGIVDGTFQGRIDEVRIYNRALNAGEVGADMEAPIGTPKAGPVAEYSFDDGNEETAADGSGHNHAGTVEGATKAPGKFGEGLQFDGEEDCVSIPVDGELQASEEFTIEAWVRPEGSGEEALPVIAMDDENSGPGEEQFSYELFGGQEARPKGWVRKAGEEGTWGVEGEEPLPEKAWSHLTLTDDGHVIRLYVDGKLGNEEVSTDVAPPLTEAEGPLTIGCGIKYGAYRHFKGRIDEVRVYDRALDAGEVASDTETPIQTPRRGPVAAYGFDEGEGTTVEDLTGDGHTATIHDAEWTTRGKYGGAMEFDSSKESYLSVPDSAELDFTEEFTLEAWVRPAAGSAEYEPLITKQTSGSKVQPYFLYEGSSEPDHPYGGTQANTIEESFAHADDPLPVDTWSHVVLTFSGTRAKLYVDGELVDDNYACPPINGEGGLEIGGATEVASYFNGRIDEVRIYNRALGRAEVTNGLDRTPPSNVSVSGELAELANQYISGRGNRTVTASAMDDRSGIRSLTLENEGTGIIGSYTPSSCVFDSPDEARCPLTAAGQIVVNAARMPEGANHLDILAEDLAGNISQGPAWIVYVDRAGPSFPPAFEVTASNELPWADPMVFLPTATDPPLSGGHAGSGVAASFYRYSLNEEPLTEWASNEFGTFEVPGAVEGDSLEVQAYAIDGVGNDGPIRSATITIPPPEEEGEEVFEEG